ncbi:hypothetical protein BU23DRAFT_329750, partial [Bimuria novae-zelandiae CBS 107.79]
SYPAGDKQNGPQCTGKTTLVNEPEADFAQGSSEIPRPAIIREVARMVLKERHFTREDITASPARAAPPRRYRSISMVYLRSLRPRSNWVRVSVRG